MSIFTQIFGERGNKEVVSRLEKRIEELQNILKEQEIHRIDRITQRIQDDADTQILSAKEVANARLEIVNLKGQIAEMKATENYEHKNEIENLTLEHSVELREQADEIEDSYKKEITTVKAEADAERKVSQEYKGLYSGSLLVVKNLEAQVKDLMSLNASLLKALPGVDVKVTSPVNVDNSTNVHSK
jgi:hypothetical protein